MTPRPFLDRMESLGARVAGCLLLVALCTLAGLAAVFLLTWAGCGGGAVTTLYISGPMTGLPAWNHPAFHEAAARLRAAGHEVVNPAEAFHGDPTLPRKLYMRHHLHTLLAVDAVVMLPGWEASAGARLERAVALELGLPVSEGAPKAAP